MAEKRQRETRPSRARTREEAPSAALARGTFLDTLRRTGVVLLACRSSGVSRATAYRWRAADEAFRADWIDAVEDHADLLEAAAIHRALHGAADRPPSDRLLERLLAAKRPSLYGDKIAMTHSGHVERTATIRIDPSDPEVQAKARELAVLLAEKGRGIDTSTNAEDDDDDPPRDSSGWHDNGEPGGPRDRSRGRRR